jgi:hypothetical protein
MTLHAFINGLVNLGVFAVPIPLMAWLDRAKSSRSSRA